MTQDFGKAAQVAAIDGTFIIEGADGRYRAATDRELLLSTVGSAWVAAGHAVPAAVLADTARQYDAAGKPPQAHALDIMDTDRLAV